MWAPVRVPPDAGHRRLVGARRARLSCTILWRPGPGAAPGRRLLRGTTAVDGAVAGVLPARRVCGDHRGGAALPRHRPAPVRSEEHTSELQSRRDIVCRLLLEKKNKK